jgi:hypothetical protein
VHRETAWLDKAVQLALAVVFVIDLGDSNVKLHDIGLPTDRPPLTVTEYLA